MSVTLKVLLERSRHLPSRYWDTSSPEFESDDGAICKARDEPPSLRYFSTIFWIDCDKL